MIHTNHIIALSGIVLAAKIWIDLSDILRHHLRTRAYVQITQSVVTAMSIIEKYQRLEK